MIAGALLYRYTGALSFLTPYLLFGMLLLTFCRISPRAIRLKPMHWWLMLVQVTGSVGVYFMLVWYSPDIAQAVMICVLAPTAAAAAVVTGMLGGSVAFLTSYTLLSNLAIALVAPFLFSFMGTHPEITFMGSVVRICARVFPVLVFPFLCAWALRRWLPRWHKALLSVNKLSFYLWAVGLTIVTGRTVMFLSEQENKNFLNEWIIAALSLAVCVAQFAVGRWLGRKRGDPISAAQALGQKNTILALWMAQTYLLPISSVGPATYIIYQNVINSWQIWRKQRQVKKNK